MGRRTSLYLTSALEAAIAADGRPLSEILWAGLGQAPKDETPAKGQTAPKNETSARPLTADSSDCPHPRARVHKGLCHQCGKAVP